MESPNPKILIVGGGIAGLATATQLARSICGPTGDSNQDLNLPPNQKPAIVLAESRKQLGGRAASFWDDESSSYIDHCQHVSMNCCTYFRHFCQQTGIESYFDIVPNLFFALPNGKQFRFGKSPLLPAPFHLGPSFLRLSHLTISERLSAARTVFKLARYSGLDQPLLPWLHEHGQSEKLLAGFWEIFLISALGEELEHISILSARKVFLDGFLANRSGYQVQIPSRPLRELLDDKVAQHLMREGIEIRRDFDVHPVQIQPHQFRVGSETFSHLISTVPWHQFKKLFSTAAPEPLKQIAANTAQIKSSPISGIHLWFDRPITDRTHTVFVGRTAHWLFNRNSAVAGKDNQASNKLFYYQVVISAGKETAQFSRDEILKKVVEDIRTVFPESNSANLIRSRHVEEKKAVFSYRPQLDEIRPSQESPLPGLYLAGDWTATNWPSTMESAVRSGYLAAHRLLENLGVPCPSKPEEPRRGLLARVLFGAD